MKLLFDQNLSFRLCSSLADLFANSAQVRQLGLERSPDIEIWEYAKDQGYAIVTQDADFANLTALFGAPPVVVWLHCGNRATAEITRLLRRHADTIANLEAGGILEILGNGP